MIERVAAHVGSLPYMRPAQARRLAALFEDYDICDALELGFFHGVSSAYIAEIMRLRGKGHLTTIDREDARSRSPNIDTLLADLGLGHLVTVHYEPSSYTWRLMKMIEAEPAPCFDFCYIDGGHSWAMSGFAFFLVEKLLRPGGWVLFDDLDWTFAHMIPSDGPRPAFLRNMPDEEITTPQIRKIWELLVKPHPGFAEFREEGRWAFARKTPVRAAD